MHHTIRIVSSLLRRLLPALAALCLLAVPAAAQTLEQVRERGHLICAATRALPGFSQRGRDGIWFGFDVDLCRAVAAAVLGDPDKVEFRSLGGDGRFAQLQIGAVDLIVRNESWTLKRDTGYGASYVTPMFYDGLAFLVPQSLGVVSAYELDNISVCVVDGGDELSRLQDFAFVNQASFEEVLYEDFEDLGVAYRAGLCDAVSAPARWLNAIRRSMPEPATHRILPERISKETLGPVVRAGDDQWFNIIRWTMFALIDAEEMGINSLNLDSIDMANNRAIQRFLGLEDDLGTPLGLAPDFMTQVIRAVGNYAEIYDRNFGPGTGAALLRGQNSLWVNGGMLYAPPIQ